MELAMIIQLLEFIMNNKAGSDAEQFLKFAINNDFDKKLTLYLKNQLISNSEKEEDPLLQSKNLMVHFLVKDNLNSKFCKNSNLDRTAI